MSPTATAEAIQEKTSREIADDLSAARVETRRASDEYKAASRRMARRARRLRLVESGEIAASESMDDPDEDIVGGPAV